MEVVVTTGDIRCAKLQSNHHHQQTNTSVLQAGCPSYEDCVICVCVCAVLDITGASEAAEGSQVDSLRETLQWDCWLHRRLLPVNIIFYLFINFFIDLFVLLFLNYASVIMANQGNSQFMEVMSQNKWPSAVKSDLKCETESVNNRRVPVQMCNCLTYRSPRSCTANAGFSLWKLFQLADLLERNTVKHEIFVRI